MAASRVSGTGRENSIVLRPDLHFNGVKIMSATMFAQRDTLGETVTAWMTANAQRYVVTEITVTQSSDAAFHCVTFSIFYFEDLAVSSAPRR